MSKLVKILGFVAVAGALTACGETAAERTATGAILGATAAMVTGENIAHGGLIGGSVGAVSCSVMPTAPNCY